MRLSDTPKICQNNPQRDVSPLRKPPGQHAGSPVFSAAPHRDQVTFGSLFREGAPVPYQQSRNSSTHSVSGDNPVSGDNCQICSVKHLLRYYQIGPDTVERIMEQGLKPYLLEMIPDPLNPNMSMKRGLTLIDDDHDDDRYDIDSDKLRDFLSTKLGFEFEDIKLGAGNGYLSRSDEGKRQFLAQCNGVVTSGKPLLISLGEGAPHPLGGRAEGHAIFACPASDVPERWHIVDSWNPNSSNAHTIKSISGERLGNYLFDNLIEKNIFIHKVKKGPDPEKLAPFREGSSQPISPSGGRERAASGSVADPAGVKPVQTVKSDTSTPSNSTAQPSGEKDQKPWYKRWWSSIQSTWRGFVDWLKSWLPGKKGKTE